jgi:hypothetical protein
MPAAVWVIHSLNYGVSSQDGKRLRTGFSPENKEDGLPLQLVKPFGICITDVVKLFCTTQLSHFFHFH